MSLFIAIGIAVYLGIVWYVWKLCRIAKQSDNWMEEMRKDFVKKQLKRKLSGSEKELR